MPARCMNENNIKWPLGIIETIVEEYVGKHSEACRHTEREAWN
jgi:hypothetical protein